MGHKIRNEKRGRNRERGGREEERERESGGWVESCGGGTLYRTTIITAITSVPQLAAAQYVFILSTYHLN